MLCTVPGCSSRKYDPPGRIPNNEISFHRFPVNPALKEVWIRNIDRGETWRPTNNARVCSKHFEDSCYLGTKTRKTLRSNAEPTKFLKHNVTDQPVTVTTSHSDLTDTPVYLYVSQAPVPIEIEIVKSEIIKEEPDTFNEYPFEDTGNTHKEITDRINEAKGNEAVLPVVNKQREAKGDEESSSEASGDDDETSYDEASSDDDVDDASSKSMLSRKSKIKMAAPRAVTLPRLTDVRVISGADTAQAQLSKHQLDITSPDSSRESLAVHTRSYFGKRERYYQKEMDKLKRQVGKLKDVLKRRRRKINTLTKQLSRVTKRNDQLYHVIPKLLNGENIDLHGYGF